MMIVIRNCLVAKPGSASRLAAQIKEAAAEPPASSGYGEILQVA